MLAGLVCLALVIGTYLLWPHGRSFAVQTQTRGLVVAFDGSAMNAWLLEGATICRRNAVRVASGPSPTPDSPCDPRLFDITPAETVEFSWSGGTVAWIGRHGPRADLEIQITSEDEANPTVIKGSRVPPNSRILVDSAAWENASTLTLGGQITIGSTPGPGALRNLLSGQYAVSERLSLVPEPVVLNRGELLSGDQVRLVDRATSRPLTVFGFIEPLGNGAAGFGATVYSPLGDAELALNRFGSVDIRISPSWIDRALQNPLFLGLSALLALVSGLSGLFAPAQWLWAGDKPSQPPEATLLGNAPASRPVPRNTTPASRKAARKT